jgi:mono/diheme cytochrome c family protein
LFSALIPCPAQTAPSDTTLGANPVFQKNCAKCHGKTAEGRHFGGPSLISDKATSDKATSDKATSDKATSDKATSDKATSDKATSTKATSTKATSTEDLYSIITNGKGRMPKYVGKLTSEEIDILVQQINKLNKK